MFNLGFDRRCEEENHVKKREDPGLYTEPVQVSKVGRPQSGSWWRMSATYVRNFGKRFGNRYHGTGLG